MDDLLELRKVHGNVFVSRLPNGQDVPWRPLSIQEYIEYDKLLRLGVYPPAYIEDEVFRKCVLSQVLVDNIENLRAGLVRAVALDILVYSGPSTIDELNMFLNMNRNESGQVMHQLVSVVCQAFPAYKPEDVYGMNYETFGLRVAQAEEKLLRTGMLTEPLSFNAPDGAPKQQQPVKQPIPEPPKENLRNQWKAQQAQEAKKVAPPVPATEEQVIIKKADIIEHQSAMTGHDKDPVHHKKEAEETAAIYSDYLEQLKSGEKLKIATPEERVAAAEKRQEETKKQLAEAKSKVLKDMAEERKELLKIREKERDRRRRRAGRKR